MKTLITIGLMFVTASMAFAQGTIIFQNRVTGVVVAPVYGAEPSDSTARKTGNTATGFPAGSQTYGGALLDGTGFSAQLFGGALGTADEMLSPVLPVVAFRTGGFAGFVVAPATAVVIPGVGEGARARLQLRAWDNRGGTVTTWDQVLLSQNNAVLRGFSQAFDSLPLGGGSPPPNLVGLTSFNLFVVPEPSVIALGVLGGIGLLLLRRRK